MLRVFPAGADFEKELSREVQEWLRNQRCTRKFIVY